MIFKKTDSEIKFLFHIPELTSLNKQYTGLLLLGLLGDQGGRAEEKQITA